MKARRVASTTAPAGIPARVHYRPAAEPNVRCGTCAYLDAGRCTMFPGDPPVEQDHVCDEWEPRKPSATAAAAPAPVPAARHNRVLAAAERRALDLEDRLVEILTPILEQAGEVAAANFEARARQHRVASGLRQTFPILGSAATSASTMVALKPTPAQAAALAEPGGDPPEDLHVTLAYLGETEGDLAEVAESLAGVPGQHAPLEGTVGGVGNFADGGKGHPAILLPSVPGLLELRHHVTEALQRAGIDYSRGYGFVPHMTLAYRQNGPEAPSIDRAGAPLNFDDLWVVRGDRETIQLPLTGVAPVTASADPDLLERIAEVAHRYRPDPPDGYGDAWWSEQDATVYWICADWSSAEEIDGATEEFLEIPGVEQVDACDECPAPKGGDWVIAYDAARPPESLEAAALDPPFCLPANLRTKTDPVRQAVVETVMKAGVEGAGISFDVTSPLAGKVLAQSGSQIVGISRTTQLDVMKTIQYAYQQGLSIPDTAKAIRAAMREAAPARARLIARTELAGAVNGASLAATRVVNQATGAGYQKVWMTAPGAPHPRHEDYDGLDGQTVGLDEPFDVGGSDLQFPGDPDGPPEEVCNCRCAMRYTDGSGGEADVEASGWPTPPLTRHERDHRVAADADLWRLVASCKGEYASPAPSPADWVAPAPEELLSVECEAPRVPLPATTAMPSPAPEPFRDTISVGAGPPLPPALVERIHTLGLDRWPPNEGEAAFRILRGAKDTEALYLNKGTGEWAESRARLHQQIVDEHFAGKTPPAEGDQKHAYFTAGGGASGKSSLRFDLGGEQLSTDDLAARSDTILVDPDRIKQMIPEYKQIADAGDTYAASGVHEESSAVAKMVVKEAQARGFNVVLDTTGSSGGFVGKIEQFKALGYDTQVSMVSTPTNTAILRSMKRGDRSGRYVAIQALKDAHRGASEQLANWMDNPAVDRWTLLDNSGDRATLVASGGGGGPPTVVDQPKLDQILAKADEATPPPPPAAAAVTDGPALPDVDALPLDPDAYVAGIQTETRRLGKQIAAARYQLKTEANVNRRADLEARMAAWEKRRDELRDLAADPDPNGELRRLTKQIANIRYEIRNGRGNARLEARLRALEHRREQVRHLLGSDVQDVIDKEAAQQKAEAAAAKPTEAAAQARSDEPARPGELVDVVDPFVTNSPTWLYNKIPGDGPGNYIRIPAQTYLDGGSSYPMGESVAFRDANGSGVVIRAELRGLSDAPAARAQIAQQEFDQAWSKIPDYMQSNLDVVTQATGANPSDAYWRKTYEGFTESAASAGRGKMTFWNGNSLASDRTGSFAHEMGHLLGDQGGPWNNQLWLDAQRADEQAGPAFLGRQGEAQPITGEITFQSPFFIGAPSVTAYGANSIKEDWAESIRLWVRQFNEGSIGSAIKSGGFRTVVRFEDAFPNRARLIKQFLEEGEYGY